MTNGSFIWDLYNEPTNRGIFAEGDVEVRFDEALETYAHYLMELAFVWAREENPHPARSPSAPGTPLQHRSG